MDQKRFGSQASAVLSSCAISLAPARRLKHLWTVFLLMLAPAPLALGQSPSASDSFAAVRQRMVQTTILGGGITNERVIAAMQAVSRHSFLAKNQWPEAYVDFAMPIGHGQTISSPYIVAYMTEQLDPQPEDKVLEVGTGSGYQAAVLSEVAGEVYTIEIVESLGRKAARTLKQLGYKNIHTRIGDGYEGWPEHAPFGKIIVTCSPEKVPAPLVEQLSEGGRLIVPVGERFQQMLYLYRKVEGKLKQEELQTTFFVPMTGEAEALRVLQADSTMPTIANGSFEKTFGDEHLPTAWYYLRQARIVEDKDAPEGLQYLKFTNDVKGRESKALQAVGVDGKTVHNLEFKFWARGSILGGAPAKAEQPPGLFVEFYDKSRKPIGRDGLDLRTVQDVWRQETLRVKVPSAAILVAIRIGLGQAVGEICFDNIEVRDTAERR
jgi:protein-L-isoaspartate(D-aspartate) O-methyltransferase